MCSYTTLQFIVNRLFSDINVSQGSVVTYARNGGIVNNHFTANLPRNLSVENLCKSLKILQNHGDEFQSLWPHFFGPTLYVLGSPHLTL